MMRVLCLLMVLLGAGAWAKSPPPGTGAADVKVNVLLMLDTSGSMSAAMDGGNYRGVAGDASGNYVLAKTFDHVVEKFDATGVSQGQIGLGQGTATGYFYYPMDVALDASGNSYVADYYNARVQKFSPSGSWIATFGAGSLGSVLYPESIALDASGNIYASYNSQLWKWGPGGGTPTAYTLRDSGGRSISSDRISIYAGDLYVVQQGGGTIYKFPLNSLSSRAVQANYRFDYLYDIEANANGVFALSPYEGVFQLDHSLVMLNSGRLFYTPQSPYDLVISLGSNPSSHLYLAGYAGVRVLDGSGQTISSAGSSTRLDALKKVVKLLVTNSDLTRGANFGLMSWASGANLRVPVSDTGAADINGMVDSLVADGGTYLDAAMQAAQTYLDGSSSPIDPAISCQKTVLIVLSDGEWQDTQASSIAATLADRGVETYVVGFQSTGGTNYDNLAKAGNTYPDSPLYADDWQSLYRVMSSFIQKVISTQLSFAAPTILPSVSGGSNQILQSSFTYRAEHQWQGRLKLYGLASDGSVGDLVWDAGELLAGRSPDQRQIWTVSEWLQGTTSLNNFTTANNTSLTRGLYESNPTVPTVAEVDALIQFVRGYDSFDEDLDGLTTDMRWPLADLYHSSPIVVGAPALATSSSTADAHKAAFFRYTYGYDSFKNTVRADMVYVGGNDGMLHAFDAATGQEAWAFIPPMLLQALSGLTSNAANASTSIYGVDGSPTVSDIYVNGQWRTILMAGLGRGGKGYFALDVTQPTSPTFMFAFQNQPENNMVRYWGGNGLMQQYDHVTVPAAYDFAKLGEAWSKPQIFLMPIAGVQKHVAVFGAGYNAGVDTTLGNAIYVVDLTDGGKLLKRIDLADGAGNVVNAVAGDVTLVTGDTTSLAKYQGALAYVVDTESKLWKLNLSNAGTLYDLTQVFDGEASNTNQRLSFFAPAAAINNAGQLWLYFGSGDQQRLQTIDSNIQNRVYGIRDQHFPDFVSVTPGTEANLREASDVTHTCPTASELGWFNRLAVNEKVTGKLTVSNEVLYVPRYTPNGDDVCASGSGSLAEHDYGCGHVFSGGVHALGQGIPTQAVIFNGKAYVGISGSQSEVTLGTGWTKSGNIIVGTSVKGALGAGQATVESWREIY